MSIRQRTSLIAVLCWAGTAKAPAASSWLEQFANSGGIGGVIETGLSGHTAVYDGVTNTMIAFGGNDASRLRHHERGDSAESGERDERHE